MRLTVPRPINDRAAAGACHDECNARIRAMRLPLRLVIRLLALTAVSAPLAAQQLTDAQRSAIRSACRSDYMNVCASVPTGTKDSLECLLQHSQQVSAGCRDALAPAAAISSTADPANSIANIAAPPAASAPPAAPAAGAPPAAAPPAAQPLSAREEARALRSQCGGDFQKFCSDVQLGGGRAVACLRAHATELTPPCRSALTSAAPH